MNTQYPVGTCMEMCPEEEIIRREHMGLLHVFERLPNQNNNSKPRVNRNRIVKEFCRSAAGQETQKTDQLRTTGALLKTISYLLHDVITLEEYPWHMIYDYIMDRFRAIRQDIVIQNLSRTTCIVLLQPMIKFYVYSAYRLCQEDVPKFDPVINRIHLLECLKRLLCIYDDQTQLIDKAAAIDTTGLISSFMLGMDSRPLMECIYIIFNLGDTVALNRAVQLPDATRRNELVQLCTKISLEFWRGNFYRVLKHIFDLPPLLLICAVLNLPKIRKNMFQLMCSAYSSKRSTYPVNKLQDILMYNTKQELMIDLEYYGICSVDENNILFSILSFKQDRTELPLKRNKNVDNILSGYNLPELLLEDEVY